MAIDGRRGAPASTAPSTSRPDAEEAADLAANASCRRVRRDHLHRRRRSDISAAEERLEGYRRAPRAAGREYDPRLVRYADFREQGGYTAMAELLDHTPRPNAVFATNNLLTVGARVHGRPGRAGS